MQLFLYVTNHEIPVKGLVSAEDEWIAEGLIEQALRCDTNQITLREIKDLEELKAIIEEDGVIRFF